MRCDFETIKARAWAKGGPDEERALEHCIDDRDDLIAIVEALEAENAKLGDKVRAANVFVVDALSDLTTKHVHERAHARGKLRLAIEVLEE